MTGVANGTTEGEETSMQRVEKGGLAWYTLASYAGLPVVHGAFTRHGGYSRDPFASLNVGRHVGDDPAAVEANHRAICAALGGDPARVVSARQVHSDRVARVDDDGHNADDGRTLDDADALITDVPSLLLMLRFADCVPVWLYDPGHHAIGLAHAGWRGTAQRIAAKTVRAMGAAFGSRPEDVIAGLGPAIGPCCFEVGPDVIEAVRRALPDAEAPVGRHGFGAIVPDASHLDLWEANAVQLRDEGVRRIEVAELCTSCHVDAFFSHRREKGRTGRFAVVAGLAASS
jgi:polyphenol oxidase